MNFVMVAKNARPSETSGRVLFGTKGQLSLFQLFPAKFPDGREFVRLKFAANFGVSKS
jgi:hypothetical protein